MVAKPGPVLSDLSDTEEPQSDARLAQGLCCSSLPGDINRCFISTLRCHLHCFTDLRGVRTLAQNKDCSGNWAFLLCVPASVWTEDACLSLQLQLETHLHKQTGINTLFAPFTSSHWCWYATQSEPLCILSTAIHVSEKLEGYHQQHTGISLAPGPCKIKPLMNHTV